MVNATPRSLYPRERHPHGSQETLYLFYRELCGTRVRSGLVRKISTLPAFELQTVQPVANRFTGYANRPLFSIHRYHEQNITIKLIKRVIRLRRMWSFLDLALEYYYWHEACASLDMAESTAPFPQYQQQVIVLKDVDGRGNSRHDSNVESRWTHPIDAIIKQWIWKERRTVVYALACQPHYLRATRLEVEANCLLGFKYPLFTRLFP